MASLFNTKISNTYVGLIKTIDNAVISSSLRELTDGSGNATGIHLNNAGDFKVTNILEFGSLKDTGENITITKFVDEADGIVNNDNDTTIPTSAAVKDFVTSQITLEDLDFSGDSGTGSVDLDSQVFAIVGTANEIETSASSQQLQIGLPTNVTIGGNLSFGDNGKAKFGTGNDLEIYHDASNSYIKDTGTGNLFIQAAANVQIESSTSGENMAVFNENGAVELYYDNSKKFETISSGATVTGDLFADGVIVGSNEFIKLGDGNQFTLFYDNTNANIKTTTGDLVITNEADDKDIIFKSDDGSGGVENYIQIDGSEGRTLFNKNIRVNDGIQVQVGSSADLRLQHSSGNNSSYIQNYTGDLYIENLADDKDIIFKSDDGSGGTTEYFRVDGSVARVEVSKSFRFSDNIQANFGSSGDLGIYHNGTDSYIVNGTGDLEIINNNDNGDISFISDNGSGSTTEYLRLDGSNPTVVFSKSSIHTDNVGAYFGTGLDLQIYHDGSDSYIDDAGTGDLRIRSNFLKIEKYTGETMATFNDDNAVSLFFNNNKKFETTSAGVTITGVAVADGLDMGDDEKIRLGDSQDLQIYHQGANSFIDEAGTGNLYIRSATNMFFHTYGSGKRWITLTENAGVELFYKTILKSLKLQVQELVLQVALLQVVMVLLVQQEQERMMLL